MKGNAKKLGVKYASELWGVFKLLLNKRVFFSTVIVSMAISLGAALCVVTISDLLIRAPLPYKNQDKLYLVDFEIKGAEGKEEGVPYAYPALELLYRKMTDGMSSSMVSYERHEILSIRSQPSVQVAFVSPSYFSFFDMTVEVGTGLKQLSGIGQGVPGAVISYDLWVSKFNKSKEILNETVVVRNVSHPIVGVTNKKWIEPQIPGPSATSDIWIHWDYNTTEAVHRTDWGVSDSKYYLIARSEAASDISDIQRLYGAMFNDRWQGEVVGNEFYRGKTASLSLIPLKEKLIGDSAVVSTALVAGALGLLLIVIVNISNLFILRTAEREKDLAIHAAVGATKSRIKKLFFMESTILFSVSIVLATVIAYLLFESIRKYFSSVLPRASELSVSFSTVFVAIVLLVVLSYIFSLVSAKSIKYGRLALSLQTSGKGTGMQVSGKVRKLLVCSQVILATIIVFFSASVLNGALDRYFMERGISYENSASLLLMTTQPKWPSQRETYNVMEAFKQELIKHPNVESVTRSSGPFVPPTMWGMTVDGDTNNILPNTIEVDAQYFSSMGIGLRYGNNISSNQIRAWDELIFRLTEKNDLTQEDLMTYGVIDQAMARKIVGDDLSKAVGKIVTYSEGWIPGWKIKIVGVVDNIIRPGETEVKPHMYIPRFSGQTRSIIKFSSGTNGVTRDELADLINKIDKRYAVSEFDVNQHLYNRIMFSEIVAMFVASGLAIIVFMLASVGLYSVIAYGIGLRSTEFGIRMSIGAKRKVLVINALKENVGLVATSAGVAVFCILIFGVSFPELFDTYFKSSFLSVLVCTVVSLFVVSALGCIIPLKGLFRRTLSDVLRQI